MGIEFDTSKMDFGSGRACRHPHLLLLVASIFAGFCRSEKAPYYSFVREATRAPMSSRFDYIIVGGGTAGCPLAATLSQNARVLVLERGGSPYDLSDKTDMANFATTLSDSSPSSPSQLFISEDGVYNARARVLGGGSVLNAGFYTHASADYIREAGWRGEEVNSSYKWVEAKVAFEPPVLKWQSAVRAGMAEVGVKPDNGFTYEHVDGTKVGGTIFDRQGHRHTSADLLEYADPDRIVVYLHATVHRVLFSTKGRPRPRAYGVIFQDAYGVFHRAELVRHSMSEVILSAGSMGSPQLLMLSGVGPSGHLTLHGIDVILDQPMVGQGMADNPMNALFIPSPLPVEVSLIQVVGITSFGSYIEAASGLSFSYSWARRLYQEFSSILNQTGAPSMMSREANPRLLQAIDPLLNATTRGGVILEKILGPNSKGHMLLRNTNPHDNPSVTFNYFQRYFTQFQDPEDLRRCVQGMSTILRVINSRAFARFRDRNTSTASLMNMMLNVPMNLRPKHSSSEFSLQQFCIDTVMTIWHYHGGCQMGRVVDKSYRVMGVNALRVIDGSTFDKSPGTNPQATVMMLGRYMGQRILRERAAYETRKKNITT